MGEEIHIKEYHSSPRRSFVRASAPAVNLPPDFILTATSPSSEKITRRKTYHARPVKFKSTCLLPELRVQGRPRLSSEEFEKGPITPLKAERKWSEESSTITLNSTRRPQFQNRNSKAARELNESLSPTPFDSADASNSAEALNKFVASTNNSFLTSLYAKDLSSTDSAKLPKRKKKMMKDYIFQVLQSICIIKNLFPIPAELIAKKSVTLSRAADSNYLMLVNK